MGDACRDGGHPTLGDGPPDGEHHRGGAGRPAGRRPAQAAKWGHRAPEGAYTVAAADGRATIIPYERAWPRRARGRPGGCGGGAVGPGAPAMTSRCAAPTRTLLAGALRCEEIGSAGLLASDLAPPPAGPGAPSAGLRKHVFGSSRRSLHLGDRHHELSPGVEYCPSTAPREVGHHLLALGLAARRPTPPAARCARGTTAAVRTSPDSRSTSSPISPARLLSWEPAAEPLAHLSPAPARTRARRGFHQRPDEKPATKSSPSVPLILPLPAHLLTRPPHDVRQARSACSVPAETLVT